MPARYAELQDGRVATAAGLYAIRIKGRLGATALSAFHTMTFEVEGGDTVLTGRLVDRSAVFGVVAQIEALGLELLELRQLRLLRAIV
jgi:hypothetical protein